jgi:hypothetical protein
MRTASLYDFNCECGKHLTTPDPVIECPACGRQIRIEWPARLEDSLPCPAEPAAE